MRQRHALRWLVIGGAVMGLWLGTPAAASEASVSGMLKGLGDMVGGVLTIPVQTLQGTFAGPPLIGTVTGFIAGTVTGVGRTLGGTFQLLGSSADTAITVAPMVLPFLF